LVFAGLAQWIFEEFRIPIAKQTLSRELRAMGFASCQPARAIMPSGGCGRGF
jgi:hypothetical protein